MKRFKFVLVTAMVLSTHAALGAEEAAERVTLAGHLSAQMRYRVRIDYTTSVNDRNCQFSNYITGMWDPKIESRYEAPVVEGEHHSLETSLDYPGGAGACGWRPSAIFVCVGGHEAADDALSCQPLFLVRADADPPQTAISLTCETRSWVCVDKDGQSPTRQAWGFDRPIQLDLAVR